MEASRTLRIIGLVASMGMITVALTFGDALAQFAYLAGQWTSQYQCPSGQTYPLTLRIDQQGQQISAVKITGDPCVAAGQTAFTGYVTGNSGQLTCFYVYDPGHAAVSNAGSALEAILQGIANGLGPQSYAIGNTSGTLSVIDVNTIEACTLRFVRAGAATPYSGSSTPWQAPAPPQQPYPYTPVWPNPGTPAPPAPSAQLQQPTYSFDDANQRYIFRVNGQLRDAYGLPAQLAFYFEYLYKQSWMVVRAEKGETQYATTQGTVSAYTGLSVTFNPYELGGHALEIPYSKLNMNGPASPWLPAVKYQMRAWAEVHVNGTRVGSSAPVSFEFSQAYK